MKSEVKFTWAEQFHSRNFFPPQKRCKRAIGAVALGLVLVGCSTNDSAMLPQATTAPAAFTEPVAANSQLTVAPSPTLVTMREGHKRAARCETPPFNFRSGGQASMTLNNDGNWCWISLRSGQTGGPFAMVTSRTNPEHGKFETAPSPSGERSRLYYSPNPGFTGNDSFAVNLDPGNNYLTVQVSVEP